MWILERILVDKDEREYPNLEAIEGNKFVVVRVMPRNPADQKYIVLNSPNVSRQHAALEYRNGEWFLSDLGSTNGTFVNGVNITEIPDSERWFLLKHGDQIGFGVYDEDFEREEISQNRANYYVFKFKKKQEHIEVITLESDEEVPETAEIPNTVDQPPQKSPEGAIIRIRPPEDILEEGHETFNGADLPQERSSPSKAPAKDRKRPSPELVPAITKKQRTENKHQVTNHVNETNGFKSTVSPSTKQDSSLSVDPRSRNRAYDKISPKNLISTSSREKDDFAGPSTEVSASKPVVDTRKPSAAWTRDVNLDLANEMPLKKIADQGGFRLPTSRPTVPKISSPAPQLQHPHITCSMKSMMHKSTGANNVIALSKTNTMARPNHSTEPEGQEDVNGLGITNAFVDILEWEPIWMEEQLRGTSVMRPPAQIRERIKMSTDNLLAEENQGKYSIYVSIFYPLMLAEFWSFLVEEQRHMGPADHKQRFEIPFEVIDRKHVPLCPLLSNHFLKVENKHTLNQPTKPGRQWIKLRCLTFSYDVLFDKDNRDLGIVKLRVQEIDKKSNKKTLRERRFFCFITQPAYFDGNIGNFATSHKNLHETFTKTIQKDTSSTKMKLFDFYLVIRMKLEYMDLLQLDTVHYVSKLAYTPAKIRQLKALFVLKYSPLCERVLSPNYEMDTDSDYVPSQADLIPAACKELNVRQRSIVYRINKHLLDLGKPEIMLLHGPPGTGKSRVIVHLLAQLLKGSNLYHKNNKILVCTPSNSVLHELIVRVDHFFKRFYPDSVPPFVRVGAGGKSSKYDIEVLAQNQSSGTPEYNAVCNSINEAKKAIVNLNEAVGNALSTDRSSLQLQIREEARRLKKFEEERDQLIKKEQDKPSTSDLNRRTQKLLENAVIIFTTLNSSSTILLRKNFSKMYEIPFAPHEPLSHKIGCCLVDEATQSTEPDLLEPLVLGFNKLVLIGDPHQLPATVLSKDAEEKEFSKSLFSRHFSLVRRKFMGKSPILQLDTQYRMHPDILLWPNKFFYANMLKTYNRVLERDKIKILPYVFINYIGEEARSSSSSSISNAQEVKLVKEILLIIGTQKKLNTKMELMTIGVITPYSEQKREIWEAIHSAGYFTENQKKLIDVETVDAFQGKEKDIVIISCVRSDAMGFLANPNRLCVALTRAKQSLIVVGNANCLSKNEMWKDLIDDAKGRKMFHNLSNEYSNMPTNGALNLRSEVEKIILAKEERSMVEEEPDRRPGVRTSFIPRRK